MKYKNTENFETKGAQETAGTIRICPCCRLEEQLQGYNRICTTKCDDETKNGARCMTRSECVFLFSARW